PQKIQTVKLPWVNNFSEVGVNYLIARLSPETEILFGENYSLLYWACHQNSFSTINLLLDDRKSKWMVNAPNGTRGITCLFTAATKGFSNCVKKLLEHNADPNLPVPGGKTPLMTAAFNGHFQICLDLLKAGADPQFCGEDGRRAINWAKSRGYLNIFTLLS